jgi:DNA-binding transcriptional MerR regulator
VSDENLLGIGTFALVCGLSVSALRHYDEVGLLRPAFVDPDTGYRRYQPGQVARARLICALRRVDLPIGAVREVLDSPADDALHTALRTHREQLLDRAHVLTQMVRVVDRYIEHGVVMPELKTPRIVQVTINVTDLAESISFYQSAFDASFNEEISSFQFGVWPTDDFFLLSVAHAANQHGVQHGPAGASRFGLLVSDVDAAHRRALDAGAAEVQPPYKVSWKPRTSCIADPSGNHIDLYQG